MAIRASSNNPEAGQFEISDLNRPYIEKNIWLHFHSTIVNIKKCGTAATPTYPIVRLIRFRLTLASTTTTTTTTASTKARKYVKLK